MEAIGNWYWIVDEIEQAGLVPRLVHPRKAKLMMGLINKTDKLDCSRAEPFAEERDLADGLDSSRSAARSTRIDPGTDDTDASANTIEESPDGYAGRAGYRWNSGPAASSTLRAICLNGEDVRADEGFRPRPRRV